MFKLKYIAANFAVITNDSPILNDRKTIAESIHKELADIFNGTCKVVQDLNLRKDQPISGIDFRIFQLTNKAETKSINFCNTKFKFEIQNFEDKEGDLKLDYLNETCTNEIITTFTKLKEYTKFQPWNLDFDIELESDDKHLTIESVERAIHEFVDNANRTEYSLKISRNEVIGGYESNINTEMGKNNIYNEKSNFKISFEFHLKHYADLVIDEKLIQNYLNGIEKYLEKVTKELSSNL